MLTVVGYIRNLERTFAQNLKTYPQHDDHPQHDESPVVTVVIRTFLTWHPLDSFPREMILEVIKSI